MAKQKPQECLPDQPEVIWEGTIRACPGTQMKHYDGTGSTEVGPFDITDYDLRVVKNSYGLVVERSLGWDALFNRSWRYLLSDSSPNQGECWLIPMALEAALLEVHHKLSRKGTGRKKKATK